MFPFYFQSDHQKRYSSPEEEQKRLLIFKDNLKLIREHNKRYEAGKESSKLGINEFADLTTEEFQSTHTGLKPQQ